MSLVSVYLLVRHAFEGVGPIGLCGGTLSYNQRLCKITRVADDPIDVVLGALLL